ncbi:GNAT family N-acetyltransferase [Isoptericola sp. NPDC019693]|uniref:GNAT family N-acetyltransferase n=1 Tax=Isoptericola sp. NPDC019693 TaxID=3364009 RepID=UPI00379E913C
MKVVARAGTVQAEAALAAGARVVARSWGAGLDVADADPRSWQRARAAVAGLAVLRELGPADREAILALDRATVADYPGDVATSRAPLTAAGATPTPGRRAFGALAGDALVAMTFVDVDGERGETDLTVVARDWRGRGLAAAVKALSLGELRAAGVRRFRTGGAAENAAIIAVNESLGYVRDEEWLTLDHPAESA